MANGEAIFGLVLLLLIILGPVFAVLWWMNRRKFRTSEIEFESQIEELQQQINLLEERLAPIISIEKETAKVLGEAKVVRSKAQAEVTSLQSKMESARSEYLEKRSVLERLIREVAIYDERLSLAEHGVYEPHFDFTDSTEYKERIKSVRNTQREMVSKKTAALIPGNWTLDGSVAKGRTMMNRQARLTLRAFNNECEAAIANTRWNNVNAMEKRIKKSAEAIDRANESTKLQVSPVYVDKKLEELYLTHEYREKQKEEKEERSEIARAEREEKRLLAEAKSAEKEENRYQALLEKARLEAGANEPNDKLKAKIAQLEASLAEAHDKTERARAMAEMTKTGYVYVISNIGSFGEDVVKIGLTRRLNPDDRVKELGDASVPFSFDTHAIIYSEEAPALETALHQEFGERRINMANMRKEFFRVSLDEVEAAVTKLAPEASFFSDREAQDYQETLAKRKQALNTGKESRAIEAFPTEL